jgi:hypothetical protein
LQKHFRLGQSHKNVVGILLLPWQRTTTY